MKESTTCNELRKMLTSADKPPNDGDFRVLISDDGSEYFQVVTGAYYDTPCAYVRDVYMIKSLRRKNAIWNFQ